MTDSAQAGSGGTRIAQRLGWLGRGVAMCGVLTCVLGAQAEVVYTADPSSTLSGDMVLPAANGTTMGDNLLHTFLEFHVRSGESATFTGPDSIANVIARVTGDEASVIDGMVRSAIASADLFLLNPNGVMFGAGAAIDIDGTLRLSTANSLLFEDGTRLMVSEAGTSGLSVAAPSAYGFTSDPASIVFDGVNIGGGARGLQVVGGDASLRNTHLHLPDQTLDFVAVGGAGEVQLGAGRTLAAEMMLGELNISRDVVTENADLDSSGDQPGLINLQAHDIALTRASVFSDAQGAGDSAGIRVEARGNLTLEQGSRITSDALTDGRGGNVDIEAGTVTITGFDSVVSANTRFGTGGGGDLTITAGEVQVSDLGGIRATTSGQAPAGLVSITSDTLRLDTAGRITVHTGGTGAAGNVTIDVDSLEIDGAGSGINTSTLGLFLQAGAGGQIGIDAGQLSLTNGAEIVAEASSPFSGSPGAIAITSDSISMSGLSRIFTSNTSLTSDGGGIDITADSLQLTGGDAAAVTFTTIESQTDGPSSGARIGINVQNVMLSDGARVVALASTDGDAGEISIRGASLTVDAATIDARALGDGAGGAIELVVDDVRVTNGGGIESSAPNPAVAGAAGQIRVTGQSLVVEGGDSRVSSSSASLGAGGSIIVAVDTLRVDGGSVAARTEGPAVGGMIDLDAGAADVIGGGSIDTSAPVAGMTGDAGRITFDGSTLTVTGAGSAVTSETLSDGAGGNIEVTASTLTVTDGGSVSARTLSNASGGTIMLVVAETTVSGAGRIDTSTQTAGTTGPAGRIELTGSELVVDGSGSTVSSQTLSDGAGGRVTLTLDRLALANSGAVDTSASSAGDAGTVSIQAGDVALTGRNSRISSSTLAAARGGDIVIGSEDLMLADGALVTVTAAGSGNAGNISLTATRDLSILDGARVETNAALSGGGNIEVNVVEQIYLRDSTLTASSGGPEVGDDGGNITIDPIFLILDNGQIVAQAVQGNGGIINLVADNFIASTTSFIDASSELGNDGEVRITSPDNAVTGVVGVLDARFARDDVLLDEPCAARLIEDRSSLVVERSGRDVSAPGDYSEEGATSACIR